MVAVREYRNVHLQCESLYEKCPYVLRLNQSLEIVALQLESMGQNLAPRNVSMESPKDECGFILPLFHILERENFSDILPLIVCHRLELNRISFHAVSIDDVV